MNSLSALYREIGGQLLRYAFSLTGEIHSAEDIVSETFLKATEHCIANRDIPSRAWFYKVARNIAFDWLRKRSRLEPHEIPEIMDSSKDADPDAVLEQSEEALQLKRAMAELPESYRSILILREYNELSYLEIAAVLGMSIDQVKVQLFRARQKLKTLYRRKEE